VPAVSELRLFSVTPLWITARELSTVEVEPPQMYVYGGPDSVQACEHLSMTI
jgi:hypothetical protein